MVKFDIVGLMPYAVILTIMGIFLELGMWLPAKTYRRLWSIITLAVVVLASMVMALNYFNVYLMLFLVIAIYRIINLSRYILQRRQADHLYSVTRQTSSWLLAVQLLSLGLATAASPLLIHTGVLSLIAVGFVGGIIIYLSTARNLKKTRPSKIAALTVNDSAPTLSVLIPARNETDDLYACLQSLVKSTYPKLEILVLDDNSQNKRTPEIIKDFAQDGVRFLAGKNVPSNWLAKNYAYQQLLENASGDLLLFCGVDTRFKPETLAIMVSELLQKKKTMISFIPANIAPNAWEYKSLLVQPSRYCWELGLPRRTFKRPPVLSTAWLINHVSLREAGSFKAVTRAAIPERMFAEFTAKHNDGYSFLQSDTAHGVASAKSFSEQKATSVRLRYPQLHQSIELTALVSILEIAVLILPFLVWPIFIIKHNDFLLLINIISCILLVISYALVVKITYRSFLIRSIWMLPLAAVYDVVLLNYSMYKYEFSTVEWKGRNACIPVMQVIDRLPQT